MSQITTVITNFKRPDHLMEAFRSCLSSGVKNLIISASGEDNLLKVAHNRIKAAKPDVVIDSIREDRGCNEMWLRGVRRVKTPWIHILHDDDKLLPGFKKVEQDLNLEVGFYHWDGAKHGKWTQGNYRFLPYQKTGIYDVEILEDVLLTENINSISPVAGLFRTEHVLETLEECEANFGEAFNIRPKMMVGNDLLIWLRALEKYKKFKYYAEPLISYGHWVGSTSFYDGAVAYEGKLAPIYNLTRQYWRTHVKSSR